MFLSDASIKRPIAMSCLIIGLVLLGLNAWRKIGLELMPKMDMPYITIVTVYPGASPDEIETDVAKRIEDAVVTIDGLNHVSSACMENVSQTLLEFNLDVDVDIAATDVREKLDLIRADFPDDVEDPKILKFDVNAKPVITMALTGEAPIDELYDYADNTLRDQITVLSGVADVQLIGGAEREVQVSLDRDKLAARGLSSLDVVKAIQEGIRTIPAGRVRQAGTEYSVKFDADYDKVLDIGKLEVANEEGQRCYIKDIGRIEMTTEELRQTSDIDGRPCITIKVVKKAEANAVKVVNLVRGAMTELKRELPGGMELVWVTDDGVFTQATVDSAWKDILLGIFLTALILFFFLYNVRTTVVIAITMPLTIIISLFFMQALDFTLNMSTLLATGLSVGILVTNSIVVLEAIVKRLDKSGNPRESARLGSGEIAVAVIASASTNMVVLFPIAMMKGKIGLFLKPFALTMLIMTLVSLFISFTLTPILCSIMLKPKKEGHASLLTSMERGWNRMFDRMVNTYKAQLFYLEKHRWAALLVLAIIVAALIHSFSLLGKIGFSMMTESDRGEIYVKLEYPTSYDLHKTQKRLHEAVNLLKDVPDLRHMLTTIGKVEGVIGQSSEGVYLAQILLKFSEKDQRELTIDDLKSMVRVRLDDYPDSIITVSMPSTIGGQATDIEMEIAGDNLKTLDTLALRAQCLAQQIPGILNSDTTVRMGKPELSIHPRRAVLADLGYPATGLGFNLRANLEGLIAGTFKQDARNYDIVVKLAEQEGKDQVKDFLFPGTPGNPLVMSSLGRIEERQSPVQITRKDKRRVSKLYANLGKGKALGSAVDEISQALDEKGNLPPGYKYNFAGIYEIMAEGQKNLAEACLIAIILLILTLSALLESFKQPFLILATLPLAVIGMLWALALTGKSLEIFVLMSGVMLIGIVVNNAILIVDQFNIHIQEGVPRHKAMVTATCERFRPIIMITLAAFLGMLPLALGQGIGAEMRNGIGIASAGGILISGILTLVVIPILYDLCTRRRS